MPAVEGRGSAGDGRKAPFSAGKGEKRQFFNGFFAFFLRRAAEGAAGSLRPGGGLRAPAGQAEGARRGVPGKGQKRSRKGRCGGKIGRVRGLFSAGRGVRGGSGREGRGKVPCAPGKGGLPGQVRRAVCGRVFPEGPCRGKGRCGRGKSVADEAAPAPRKRFCRS